MPVRTDDPLAEFSKQAPQVVTFCPRGPATPSAHSCCRTTDLLGGSTTVNKLSDSLMDLAGRVKKLEDSAAAAVEENVQAELARGEADKLAGKR